MTVFSFLNVAGLCQESPLLRPNSCPPALNRMPPLRFLTRRYGCRQYIARLGSFARQESFRTTPCADSRNIPGNSICPCHNLKQPTKTWSSPSQQDACQNLNEQQTAFSSPPQLAFWPPSRQDWEAWQLADCEQNTDAQHCPSSLNAAEVWNSQYPTSQLRLEQLEQNTYTSP